MHATMKRSVSILAPMLLLIGASGCNLRHDIANDYGQYLTNNSGTQLPNTDKSHFYFQTAATQSHHYEFRSAMTGAANVWMVDFGRMLDTTMASSDVQKAFGNIAKSTDAQGSESLLLFDLKWYSFEDFGAHIKLQVQLMQNGAERFSKLYVADGKSQGGKMFWGGAFAQRNAVQQSTKLALDEILRQLIADLNAQP